MVIIRQGLPITAQFAFFVSRARRSVEHQMIGSDNFFQTAQSSSQKGSQLAAIGTGARLFESMVMAAVEQPDFIRHARGIRAERVVIALHVDDALSLLF